MLLSKLENYNVPDSELIECDVFIFCDYPESRSSYVASAWSIDARKKYIAGSIYDRISDGFDEDVAYFPDLTELLASFSVELSSGVGEFKVVADISCMDQSSMAELLSIVAGAASVRDVELVVLYSIAMFSPPQEDSYANASIEPVHTMFAGWSTPDSRPTSLILGLGYEPHKAEGASEFFEPNEQWVFLPRSPIPDFLPVVRNNNKALIQKAVGSCLIEYEVDDPQTTYGQLEMVISILLKASNPVLLPFGPKIFFFLCLIQCLRHPEIGVWKVSKAAVDSKLDVQASGIVVGLRCVFSAG